MSSQMISKLIEILLVEDNPGDVRHELRNPLGAIKNAAYFLNNLTTLS